MINNFFMYGTLKVGGKLAWQLDEFRRSSIPAKAEGFDLYTVIGIGGGVLFPAAVPGSGTLVGELHEFPVELVQDVIAITDRIEGYTGSSDNSLYIRKTIKVIKEDSTEEEAYFYQFNFPIEKSYKKILSGKWQI